MEHSYHLLLLLPTILLSTSPLSALAYCPEAYPPETCSHLHTTFETALLASRQNLYNLKEEFYPSSHKSPVYGQVSFALKIKPDISKSMCPSDNKEEKQATPEELSSSYMFIWTSSGLLGRIDPMTLSFYQPEILSKIYSSVGILDYSFDFQKPQPSFIELELKLDVENNLTCTPSVRQLTTSLADMTSWMKIYATTQGPLTAPWSLKDKGYGLFTSQLTVGSGYRLLFASCVCLSVILTVVIWSVTPVTFKKVSEKAKDGSCCCLFWGAAIVVAAINMACVVAEPTLIIFGHSFPPHHTWSTASAWGRYFFIAKEFQIAGFWVLDLVVAVFTVTIFGKGVTQFPIPVVLEAIADWFFCCSWWNIIPGYEPGRAKLLQGIAIWNFLFLTHLLMIAALPTVLWAFIFPIRMLSVTLLVVVCVLILVSLTSAVLTMLPITHPRRDVERRNGKFHCKMVLYLLLVLLPFVPMVTLLVLYLNLITTEMSTDTPTDKLESFVPTAALSIVLWLMRNKVDNLAKQVPEPNDVQMIQP